MYHLMIINIFSFRNVQRNHKLHNYLQMIKIEVGQRNLWHARIIITGIEIMIELQPILSHFQVLPRDRLMTP